jgi:hypothetical protein
MAADPPILTFLMVHLESFPISTHRHGSSPSHLDIPEGPSGVISHLQRCMSWQQSFPSWHSSWSIWSHFPFTEMYAMAADPPSWHSSRFIWSHFPFTEMYAMAENLSQLNTHLNTCIPWCMLWKLVQCNLPSWHFSKMNLESLLINKQTDALPLVLVLVAISLSRQCQSSYLWRPLWRPNFLSQHFSVHKCMSEQQPSHFYNSASSIQSHFPITTCHSSEHIHLDIASRSILINFPTGNRRLQWKPVFSTWHFLKVNPE